MLSTSFDATGLTGIFDSTTGLTAYKVTTSNTFNMGWGTATGVFNISVPQNIDTTYYLDSTKKLAKYDAVTTYKFTDPNSVTHDIKNIANYNSKGQPINYSNSETYTNSNGVKTSSKSDETTYTYDANGNQLGHTETHTNFNAGGKNTSSYFYTYDSSGHNIGGGNTWYDSNGVKTNSSTYTTTATFDASGRTLTSKQTTTQFDALDHKTGSTTSDSTNTYDSAGHQLTSKQTTTQFDALDHKTSSTTDDYTFTYDTTGQQLTTQRTISNFDATGNKVSFEYDENGNQIYFANAPSSDNKFVGYANIKQNLIIDKIDATKADFNFNIYEGQNSYTFNIAGFNTGDKLSFSNSTAAPKITNTNTSDGIIDVVCNTTTIHLTGLTPVQDQAITSDITTFNNIFGTGAIGTI